MWFRGTQVDSWDQLTATMVLPRFSPMGFQVAKPADQTDELRKTLKKLRANYHKQVRQLPLSPVYIHPGCPVHIYGAPKLNVLRSTIRSDNVQGRRSRTSIRGCTRRLTEGTRGRCSSIILHSRR
eukprot:COSAG05_NODE_1106_length_5866_cov_2.199584_2_plen_125_part_00